MHCSCLLLFVSFLVVISNVNAASVHKRHLIPTNINIDIKLGKGSGSAAKTAEQVSPAPGSRKTVLNAPFGLGSVTITTNRKNSSNTITNEAGKPCNPESELIQTTGDINNPHHGGSSNFDTLGGKGGAFFGPPHPPPHPDFGGPPPPHDYHHPYPHYPSPPSHHFHHYPPPPHQHHPDCHHGEFPQHPSDSSTKIPLIPESKPDAKFTTASPLTPKDKTPTVTSTTDNVDSLIDDIFNGSNSSNSTTIRTNIDANDREQTGEGNLDIRMPKTRSH